jgi:hypothetical protein
MHTTEQTGVLRGIGAAILVSAIAVIGGHYVFPASAPVSDAVPDRLTCYLPYLALMAAPLIVSIGRIAQHRYFAADAIDGTNPPQDIDLARQRAVLTNTVEQLLLAVLIHFSLLAVLPYDWLNIVPVMAIWWTVSRFVFMAAYARGAAARSFGFAATFYPNVAGAIATPFLLIANGLAGT